MKNKHQRNTTTNYLYTVIVILILSALFAIKISHSTERGTTLIQEDEIIASVITARYIEEDSIKTLKIKVQTKNGAVTLSGIVPDKHTKEKILMIAQNTEGVTNVISELVIQP